FSGLNYLDVELGIVDETLKKNNLYDSIAAGNPVHPARAGQLFGADAIITGEVTSYGKNYAVLYSDIQAGLKARMIRCNDGELLWEHEDEAHIRDGKIPTSILSLVTAVATTLYKHKSTEIMAAATVLCSTMVDTIPDPPVVSEPPPRIEIFIHDGAGRLLSTGDSLTAALVGDAGLSGSWDISESIRDLKLSEKEPGIYVGTYKVKAGDRVIMSNLKGRLKSRTGLESLWVDDILGPVTLGKPTILPPEISEDRVLTYKKSPYLINEDLNIQEGATVTIEPGTVIWGRNSGIFAKGTIRAQGTSGKPIIFSSMDESGWKGIVLVNNEGDNLLTHCEISGADVGILAVNSVFDIDLCSFQENGRAVVVLEKGTAKIRQSLIQYSKKEGIEVENGNLDLTGSIVSENHGGGILLKAADTSIINNNISNNGEWDFKAAESQNTVLARNNWWGNAQPDQHKIVGPVSIEPVLDKPIDLPRIKELHY
ncbi:GNA1162 family protein, partial [Thermodesulfobacteriota bacterium]